MGKANFREVYRLKTVCNDPIIVSVVETDTGTTGVEINNYVTKFSQFSKGVFVPKADFASFVENLGKVVIA
jgi:hypothetical protein